MVKFFMKINSVELAISAVRQSQYPEDNKPEFLLCGRSNVGKSSFINSIIELWKNPTICKKISNKNLSDVKKFSLENSLKDMTKIYKEILT